MTLLLEHFDTLLATPADVEQLNRAILTLAVQGRLVAQDPGDEPASEIVKRIIHKERKENALKPVSEKEKTFTLPQGWIWIRFEDVVEILMGQSPPGNTYNETGDGVPLINGPVEFGNGPFEKTQRTKFTTEPTKMCKEGDLLVCVRGSTTGRTNIAGFNACIGRGVAALRSKFGYQEYINYFILYYRPYFFSLGTGSTFPSVSYDKIQTIAFPLPPLAEQKRIVARVEALFAQTRALAEKLSRAQADLAALNQSALAHLLAACVSTGSTTADEFDRQWDFITAHFESLFTRPEHIAPLRQSILELAVRGKLTRRESGDESARELLGRIRQEKVESGKKEVFAPVKESEKPFLLPDGWEWAKLDEILLDIEAGKSFLAEGRPATDDEYGVLKVSAVSWGKFLANENKALLPGTDFRQEFSVKANDLLISRANTAELVGAVVLVDKEYPNLLLSDKTLRLICVSEINKSYLVFALRAPWVRQAFASQAIGTSSSMRNISQDKIRSALISVPPLAEQARIVARVEALLGLCAALESRQRAAQEERARLVESVLNVVAKSVSDEATPD